MAEPRSPAAPEAPTAGKQGQKGLSENDLNRLTEKVYRLLLADLRLEQARGEDARRRS